MPARYAEKTEVPVERSKRHIEELLVAHKAEGYHTGWDASRDVLEFLWKGKQIRFVLPRPELNSFRNGRRNQRQLELAMEQADRQRWRALFLVIRAKIEAVEAGLAVFEEEFLASIVVPGRNQTIGEIMLPRLRDGSFDLSRALPAAVSE